MTGYEPGRVYMSPDTHRRFEYLPDVAPDRSRPFREVATGDWCMPVVSFLVGPLPLEVRS